MILTILLMMPALFLMAIIFLLIYLSNCIPKHEIAPEEEYERARAILKAEEPTEW